MNKSRYTRIFLFPFNKVKQGSNVVIWGKGNIGTQYYKQLESLDYASDVRWVDTASIQDEQIFIKDNKEAVFVIGISSAVVRREITKKLVDNGINEKNIINGKPLGLILSPALCICNDKIDLNILNDEIKNELKRFFELIKLKLVFDYKYVRVGADNDGGYVLLNDLPGGVAYSFGISGDVSWDDDMAGRGYELYMYDHTIEALPHINKAFHFFKEGIADSRETEELKKLETFIKRNNHTLERDMILKIDVEGAEWGVFEDISETILKQFSQIVVEFHGLCNLEKLSRYNDVLEKINKYHQPVHYHINNCGDVYWFDDKPYGDTIELTFANRTKYKFVEGKIKLPRNHDAPNCKDIPEIVIGSPT